MPAWGESLPRRSPSLPREMCGCFGLACSLSPLPPHPFAEPRTRVSKALTLGVRQLKNDTMDSMFVVGNKERRKEISPLVLLPRENH